MSRLLIAVGCNTYSHLSSLSGAERDAQDMFSLLTDPVHGEYDPDLSQLVLSPTLAKLRSALDQAIFSETRIDTLTFFFAGHGGVKTGNYWICLSDTNYDKLSATGFNIGELFTRINEVQPRHTNIILDACAASGIVSDLGVVLKPELIGTRDSPGISIFASSAADQEAGESDRGGFATGFLRRAIVGDLIVQSERPTLDLVEIGGVISSEMQKVNFDQTPTVWGFNLFGQSRFCKNPKYQGEKPQNKLSLPDLSVGSSGADIVRGFSDKIWQQYFSLDENFSSQSLVDLVEKIVRSLPPGESIEFIRGITSTFRIRAASAADSFRVVEVISCLICAVSRSTIESIKEQQLIIELAVELVDEINNAVKETADLIDDNRFRIAYGGPAAIYHLPLRLTKLLGWCGAANQISAELARGNLFDADAAARLTNNIVEQYIGSLVAMNDLQAPFLLTFFKACLDQAKTDWAESVAGSIFHSLVSIRGQIAAPSIPSEKAFEYILRRSQDRFTDAYNLVARPSETLSVLLMASDMFSLEGVIDPYLHALDHVSFNLFIPQDYSEFSEVTVERGVNHTFQIGHGIWKCADFKQQWQAVCAPQIAANPSFKSAPIRIAAIVSSLIQPNRTPWIICVPSVDPH
jgi:hypothetical protein